MSNEKMNFNPGAMYRYDPERGFVEVQAMQAVPCPLPFSAVPKDNASLYGNVPVFAPHYDHLLLHGKIQETMPQIVQLQNQINELARMQNEFTKTFGNIGMKAENAEQDAANRESTEKNADQNGHDEDDNRKHLEKKGLSQEKIQEIYEALSEAYNGNPDPNKFMQIFQGISHDFWKGLAVGSGAVLLLNCTPLKAMLGSVLGSVLGSFDKSSSETDYVQNQQEEDQNKETAEECPEETERTAEN